MAIKLINVGSNIYAKLLGHQRLFIEWMAEKWIWTSHLFDV